MVLIAQIALGVIIGGNACVTVHRLHYVDAGSKKGKERWAVELLVAGAVIVVVLVAIAAMQ